MREIIDLDGNVIRPGMTIVCFREVWIVASVAGRGRHQIMVADRIMENGRKCRLIVGRKRLRCVSIIGFQAPKITYP
jgi:hypothetical protein